MIPCDETWDDFPSYDDFWRRGSINEVKPMFLRSLIRRLLICLSAAKTAKTCFFDTGANWTSFWTLKHGLAWQPLLPYQVSSCREQSAFSLKDQVCSRQRLLHIDCILFFCSYKHQFLNHWSAKVCSSHEFESWCWMMTNKKLIEQVVLGYNCTVAKGSTSGDREPLVRRPYPF